MKQRTVVAWVLCLALALTIAACSENSGTTDPGGSTLTGDLVGDVVLFGKDFQNRTDHSGAVVSVEGTDFSAVTDTNGRFRLEGLPGGTYVITYSKPGFSTYKVFGYPFVGGGTAYMQEVRLPEKITYVIEKLSVLVDTKDSASGIWFEAELREPDGTPPLYPVGVTVHLGPTSTLGKEAVYNFSMHGYESTEGNNQQTESPMIRDGRRVLRKFISKAVIKTRNLESGSTAYAVASAYGPYTYSYYDPELRQDVPVGTVDVQSDVVAFKVP